jgi:hypothetical protein
MIHPATIDPNGIYDDGAIVSALAIPSATLVKARRKGHLQFTRKGRRILYMGKWVLAWLEEQGNKGNQPAEE